MPTMPARLRRPPDLHPGDHLTVEEFLRRYDAMPAAKKAELVEGIVYMPSPVKFAGHAEPHFDLQGWLCIYKFNTPGVRGGDNSTLILPAGLNVVQPDMALFVPGNQCRVNDDGYLEGVPSWLGEVSASSAGYDLHEKLRAYERNKVREYVVWRVEDEAIDWFVLRGGKFKPLIKSPEGWFKSKAFPGLWMDPQALIDRDPPRLLAALNEGMRSAEYRAFAEKLRMRHT